MLFTATPSSLTGNYPAKNIRNHFAIRKTKIIGIIGPATSDYEMLNKEERVMRCHSIDGGVLKSKRHVNLPDIRGNHPAITEKDRRDILFAVEQEVDFIALPFVRSPDDIRELKTLLGDLLTSADDTPAIDGS